MSEAIADLHTEPTPIGKVWERFMRKVSPEPNSGCWLWTGALQTSGYGFMGANHKRWVAHRFSYLYLVGPIPDGFELDHLCRVRSCVNPRHLEPVTHRENAMRGISLSARHARATHCPCGLAYSGDNLYKHPNRNHRQCRRCMRDAGRRFRQRRKDAREAKA